MGEEYNKYDIDLNIDINNKFISLTTKLNYHYKFENSNEIKLYLHKDLNVEYITCNKPITYEVDKVISNWCPFIEESKSIRISFNENISKMKILILFLNTVVI